MNKCPHQFKCPKCGDNLIHQGNRGLHESSSAWGQHIHDEYPITFYYCDIDGIILKNMTRIMRIVEQKPRGRSIKRSEQAAFNKLHTAIQYLIANNAVDKQSGIFVLECDPPYDSGLLHEYTIAGWKIRELDKAGMVAFETGMPLP